MREEAPARLDTALSDLLAFQSQLGLDAQSTVPSRPIIFNLNVFEDRLTHLFSRHYQLMLYGVHRHYMKETLYINVVSTISLPIHTLF